MLSALSHDETAMVKHAAKCCEERRAIAPQLSLLRHRGHAAKCQYYVRLATSTVITHARLRAILEFKAKASRCRSRCLRRSCRLSPHRTCGAYSTCLVPPSDSPC